jgi:hypothetical protein
MEQETPPKIIFGLSPKATIINVFVLAFLGQLLWVLVYLSQFPAGFDFKHIPDDFKTIDNVPWYYDMPLTILSMVMGLVWIQYTYKIENGDYSWRAIKYKYFYLIGGLLLFQMIVKFFLIMFLV